MPNSMMGLPFISKLSALNSLHKLEIEWSCLDQDGCNEGLQQYELLILPQYMLGVVSARTMWHINTYSVAWMHDKEPASSGR